MRKFVAGTYVGLFRIQYPPFTLWERSLVNGEVLRNPSLPLGIQSLLQDPSYGPCVCKSYKCPSWQSQRGLARVCCRLISSKKRWRFNRKFFLQPDLSFYIKKSGFSYFLLNCCRLNAGLILSSSSRSSSSFHIRSSKLLSLSREDIRFTKCCLQGAANSEGVWRTHQLSQGCGFVA